MTTLLPILLLVAQLPGEDSRNTNIPDTDAYFKMPPQRQACAYCSRRSRRRGVDGMPPETSAGFAAGRLAPCLRQAAFWKIKKVVKALGGAGYLAARERWLSRRGA